MIGSTVGDRKYIAIQVVFFLAMPCLHMLPSILDYVRFYKLKSMKMTLCLSAKSQHTILQPCRKSNQNPTVPNSNLSASHISKTKTPSNIHFTAISHTEGKKCLIETYLLQACCRLLISLSVSRAALQKTTKKNNVIIFHT